MKQTTLQTDIINRKTETEKTDRQSETDYTTNRYNKQAEKQTTLQTDIINRETEKTDRQSETDGDSVSESSLLQDALLSGSPNT